MADEKVWAFGVPEWDAIKIDMQRLSDVLGSTIYRHEYVERVCRENSDLRGTVRALREEIEALKKEK